MIEAARRHELLVPALFGDPSIPEGCIRDIRKKKKRLSWSRFCSNLTAFAQTL